MRHDDRHECQKRIVEERAGKIAILLKRKGKRQAWQQLYAGRGTEKSDEDPDGKSKRRPLGWIINREQPAKRSAEHN